jgi:hypothetical protein
MYANERLQEEREQKQEVQFQLEDVKLDLTILKDRLEDVSDEVRVTLEILQKLQWDTKNVSPQGVLTVLADFFQNDLSVCIANLEQAQQEVH